MTDATDALFDVPAQQAPPLPGALTFLVVGHVAAQGSKRHVGHGVMVESSKHLKPWRDAIIAAAVDARQRTGHSTYLGPVRLTVKFNFPRPKSHYGSGRNAGLLRDAAPIHHAQKPDADKCLRALCDALSLAGVWRDDAQAAQCIVTKDWTSRVGGAAVVVEPLP